jgi:hypothetical protein
MAVHHADADPRHPLRHSAAALPCRHRHRLDRLPATCGVPDSDRRTRTRRERKYARHHVRPRQHRKSRARASAAVRGAERGHAHVLLNDRVPRSRAEARRRRSRSARSAAARRGAHSRVDAQPGSRARLLLRRASAIDADSEAFAGAHRSPRVQPLREGRDAHSPTCQRTQSAGVHAAERRHGRVGRSPRRRHRRSRPLLPYAPSSLL